MKAERANPGGSIKDRIGLSMIEDAERRGVLGPGQHDRRADVGQHRHRAGDGRRRQGLPADPRHARVDVDRAPPPDGRLRRAARADAARDGHEGRDRACRRSSSRETHGAWMPQQFENPANIEVHRHATAAGDPARLPRGRRLPDHRRRHRRPHHRRQRGAQGALSRACRRSPSSPPKSAVISGGEPSPHRLQGIGAGFVPANLHTDDARRRDPGQRGGRPTRTPCAPRQEEGIFVGPSSGAALAAVAQKLPDLPDGSTRADLLLRHGRALLLGRGPVLGRWRRGERCRPLHHATRGRGDVAPADPSRTIGRSDAVIKLDHIDTARWPRRWPGWRQPSVTPS